VPLEEKFAGLVLVNSGTVWRHLRADQLVRVSPIPIPDKQDIRGSSTWRGISKELPSINNEDKHENLMTKVSELMGKLARQHSEIRYWVDNGSHKAGEIYPDLTLKQTPTKKFFNSNERFPH